MKQFSKRNASCVLDEAAVRQLLIAQRDHGGVDVREAADFYGVGPEAIRRVLRRDTWRHVRIGEAVTQEAIAASQERFLKQFEASREATAAKGAEIVEQLGGPAMSDNARALLATLRGERPARPDDLGNSGDEAAV